MKRIAILLLCLSLLLCACGSTPAQTDPTTEPATVPTTQAPTTEPTTVPTTEAPTEETVPETTAPVVLYRHPLTGELLEEPMTVRPVAVVTNNISTAQPMMGIGSADIVIEHMAEGGGTITRVLAIYTDLENAGVLGSIRSARTYLLDLARNFNAPIVHCGYSDLAQKNIRNTKYPSYNQFVYPEYFYRDQGRLDSGYASEHTMMIKATDLLKGLQESEFDLTAASDANYGMTFADDAALDGESAQKITFKFFSASGKSTILTYDKDEGVYYGAQKWKGSQASITDGNTGDKVPFKNVLILNVKVVYADDRYHMLTTMTGEGTGYFALDGKYIPIKWYRASTSDPFTYTTMDGDPITFGVGRTYIGMRPTSSPDISFE